MAWSDAEDWNSSKDFCTCGTEKKRQSKQIRNSILDLIWVLRRRLGAHCPRDPYNRLALPGDTACRNTQPNGNLNTQSTQTDIGGIYSMLSILCSQAFIIEAPQRQYSGRKQIPRYWSETGPPLSALVFEDMGGCGFEPATDFDLLRNSTAQDVPCKCFCEGLTGKTKWVYNTWKKLSVSIHIHATNSF